MRKGGVQPMNTSVKRISPKDIVISAMFAALTAVLAQITLPLPSGIPLTLQTFAVALTGYTLSHRLGTAAISIYILMGSWGFPVFSGFRGGLSVIAGPTGGFIIGFVFTAFFCGLGAVRGHKTAAMLLGTAGILLCHLTGALHFTAQSELSFSKTLLTVNLPYFVKDIACIVIACKMGMAIRKRTGQSRQINREH